MSLQRLRWLTIVLAISFLIVVQAVAMGLVMPSLGRIYGHALSISAYCLGVIAFTVVIFRVIDGMQQRIVRQNEELTAVNAVSRSVAGSLDLDRSMNAALNDVMQVSRAVAGQIVVTTDGGARTRVYSDGPRRELALLQRLASGDAVPAEGRQAVTIPLEGQDRTFGTLNLLIGGYAGPAGDLGGLLAGIGAQIATAVHAAVLYEEVLHREKEFQALYEIAVDITTFKGGEGILPSIVERAREMTGAEAAAVCLARTDDRGVELAARSGRSEMFRAHEIAWLPLSPSTREEGYRPRVLGACPLAMENSNVIHSPLRVGQTWIGELCVTSADDKQFTDEDRRLLDAMADLAAIAVQKAGLLEKERQVAVLEERERLSREMHDSLAQVLGYLHLKAQDTHRALHREDYTKVSNELEDMQAVAHEAYADVREAIIGLRASIQPDGGIAGTLKDYLVKYSRRAGIHTELEVDSEWRPRFSPEVAVQVVRVVQEALTNVRKHANADWARVVIGRSGNEATIVVEDNGCGFDSAVLRQPDVLSFGMRTMRERVERVGGRFTVDSVPGEGTKVQIFLPVNGGHDHDRG
ncbi:MAG TPA: GAF domain-containing sensor histidine kinase [Dehalococcoidia bacterium]|nr:GAF domain-containing sensor histidine kinase [Dehalococcoidia bacterium]